VALCRPGRPKVTKNDEAWAEGLRDALDGVPVTPNPTLHLAAGGRPCWVGRDEGSNPSF
jgi:hypothetical protein